MILDIPDFSGTAVLVLGDIMLDSYIWGDVRRISPEAPIPVVHVQKRTPCLGGAGNVACNLVGLGCSVKVLGVIGNDHAGSQIANLLEQEQIARALHNLTKITGTDFFMNSCH